MYVRKSLKRAISKTMGIVIGLVIVIAVVAGVLIYMTTQVPPTTTPTTTKPKIEKVKIGIIEPLTGRYAVFGQEAVDAARLLVDIINNELGGVSSLGGAKLELYVEDAGTSPDTAALAAERLISNYRPHVILGAYISRLTAAVAEVTEREKIP
ncbi:MAG: ABC transporter substrate-binding protein, partial [Zestosphaera sp.]